VTAFPRVAGALPRIATPLRSVEGLRIWSQAGKPQPHGFQQWGRTWDEVYGVLDTQNPSVRAFLETVNRSLREGLFWDVQHPYWHFKKGVGGGSPLSHSVPQLITDPENFSVWTNTNALVLAAGQMDPFGMASAYRLTDNSTTLDQLIQQAITFTGDGTKAIAGWIKKGNTPPATQSRISLFDSTAGTGRLVVDITGWTGSVPTVSVGQGTFLFKEDWGNGWWRIGVQTTSALVAANANSIVLRASQVVAETGDILMFGWNAWDSTVVGPYRGVTRPGPLSFPTTQEGTLLYVRGAPVSTTGWLMPGDLIQITGTALVFDVTAQVDTDAAGGAKIPINPPLFAGVQLASGVAITIDPTLIMFRGVIVAVQDYPVIDGTQYLDAGMTITWREQPT